MDLDQAMIVAGIGCRKDVPAADIVAVIGEALKRAGCGQDALSALATHADKGKEAGLAEVALSYALPLIFVAQGDLEAAAPRCETHSDRAMATKGVPSVAEAAALAAAGEGARLLLPRIVVGAATCALASDGVTP
jgi:cobalt-precorrin 5A hydrolase